MKAKSKRLFAAVHDYALPEHKPCIYFNAHPLRYESLDIQIQDKNPHTGAEYEVDVIIVYEMYFGKNSIEDPPQVEFLQVWHFREKIGMWHLMNVSLDTENHLCDIILEKETDRRSYDDSKYWAKVDSADYWSE